MNKNKIIAFRVDEEKFNKYSSLNIKERKKFVNKCNELLEKFLLKVNNSKVNNSNVNNLDEVKVNNSKVNNSNVNNLDEVKVNNSNVNNSKVNNSNVNNLDEVKVNNSNVNNLDEVKSFRRLVKPPTDEEFDAEAFLDEAFLDGMGKAENE